MDHTHPRAPSEAASQEVRGGYRGRPAQPRWPLLAAIIAAHMGAIGVLGAIFAPDLARTIERDVIAAFTLAPEEEPPLPPPAPPPASEPAPDGRAQGDPGRRAVPDPVTAPPPRLPQPTLTPRPPIAATGTAPSAGASEQGAGTGASGAGAGSGAGDQGDGRGEGRGGGGAVTRPEHISGTINNARDYPIPPGGRAERRGTEVIVKVIVGVDGRARDCSIYRASPDPEADRTTCRLVEERLGFRPARDASGAPVPAPFYWRQRWF